MLVPQWPCLRGKQLSSHDLPLVSSYSASTVHADEEVAISNTIVLFVILFFLVWFYLLES